MMGKISFNITEHKPTGVHSIKVVIEQCNPMPLIDVFQQAFEAEMNGAKVWWEERTLTTTIEFDTTDELKAKMLRQAITEHYFEQGITVN